MIWKDWKALLPGASSGKEPTCQCQTWDVGWIPGWGRPPGRGHGNPFQNSCLGNPMNRGDWLVTIHGVAKSWTRQKWLSMHAAHTYFQDIHPGVKFLSQRVCAYLVLLGAASLLSKLIVLITFRVILELPLPNLDIVRLQNFCQYIRCRFYLIIVFHVTLLTNEVEHLCMCCFALPVYYLNSLFLSCLYILACSYWFVGFLYKFE